MRPPWTNTGGRSVIEASDLEWSPTDMLRLYLTVECPRCGADIETKRHTAEDQVTHRDGRCPSCSQKVLILND